MPLSIKAVYWFEISEPFVTLDEFLLANGGLEETLTALSELRSEISGVLGPRESEIFQHFCQKPILCNMSCDASPTPFSNRLQPVVVSPHSIISEAATEEHIPHPALNTEQMNRFVDRQIMDLLGEDLYGLSVSERFAPYWKDGLTYLDQHYNCGTSMRRLARHPFQLSWECGVPRSRHPRLHGQKSHHRDDVLNGV
jgi:hypothetical protein